jgi:hypothetical protein
MRQKLVSLDISFEGRTYSLHKVGGFLYSSSSSKKKVSSYSDKIENILNLIDYPYSIYLPKSTATEHSKLFKLYAFVLTFLTRLNFKLGILCSRIKLRKFKNSTEAILFFRHQLTSKNQSELCLARCMFAASTSKLFKEKGAIIIGAFLPTNSLHAWVVENGVIADPFDHIWVNYKPISIIMYE